MVSVISNTKSQLLKKTVLIIERNAEIKSELYRILTPFYSIIDCDSLEQGTNAILINRNFNVILVNANLNPLDHSFMDGFLIVRMSHILDTQVSVIVYTDNLHPLAIQESTSYGTFKILDLSSPEFKKSLLESINFAIKMLDWQSQSKVQKKNKIIYDILKQIPLVSPIKWNYVDETLYNCFFIANTHDPFGYANSWSYICQAARNNGHKFFNGSCLITIAAEEVVNTKYPRFILINPLGQSAVKKSLDLADILKNISGTPVIIKKVTETQKKYFLISQRCKILPKSKSKKLVDQYDDIYPQVVVNLKAFMDRFTSKEFSDFRRNITRFSQRNYSIKTTKPELFEDFINIVLKWKQSFIARYKEHKEFTKIPKNDDYYINPYYPIFLYYSKSIDNKNTISSLFYIDTIPVGFSFLSRVSPICMAMYANICDTEYEGLAEFMLYHNFTKAFLHGYQFVNLGGTESKYLYGFYKKFEINTPTNKSLEMKSNHLIYQ